MPAKRAGTSKPRRYVRQYAVGQQVWFYLEQGRGSGTVTEVINNDMFRVRTAEGAERVVFRTEMI